MCWTHKEILNQKLFVVLCERACVSSYSSMLGENIGTTIYITIW